MLKIENINNNKKEHNNMAISFTNNLNFTNYILNMRKILSLFVLFTFSSKKKFNHEKEN